MRWGFIYFVRRLIRRTLIGNKNIIYVRHARRRMKWRKISEDEVMKALNHPDKTFSLGEDRYHAYKMMGLRNIRVTYRISGQDIIVLTAVNKSD